MIQNRYSTLPTIAVFDFDGTLTRQDSLFPFLRMAVGQWRFWLGIGRMLPILIRYILKLIPNWQAKERLFIYFLAGQSERELCQIGQRFALKRLPALLRPEAVRRLRWHQTQGHQVVLVSASLEAYLSPWARLMGIDQVIGTRLKTHSGQLTGRLLGKNCFGQEKVERLKTVLGDLGQYCIYAYGDSRGDKELLAIATFPYFRTFCKK